MRERYIEKSEQEPKREDAGKLAELVYFTHIQFWVNDDSEMLDVLERIGSYLTFRAEQDPEMGHILVDTFESFRDPRPEMEKLEPLQGMQEQANYIRETLGLPQRALPQELPPPPCESWVAPQ